MLTVIQWYVHLSQVSMDFLILLSLCSNRMAEANESLYRLHDLVQIVESNVETSVQLRELISRPGQHYVPSIYAASTSGRRLIMIRIMIVLFQLYMSLEVLSLPIKLLSERTQRPSPFALYGQTSRSTFQFESIQTLQDSIW